MTYIYRTRDGREIRIDDLTEAMATQSEGRGSIREATSEELNRMNQNNIGNGDDLPIRRRFQ